MVTVLSEGDRLCDNNGSNGVLYVKKDIRHLVESEIVCYEQANNFIYEFSVLHIEEPPCLIFFLYKSNTLLVMIAGYCYLTVAR